MNIWTMNKSRVLWQGKTNQGKRKRGSTINIQWSSWFWRLQTTIMQGEKQIGWRQWSIIPITKQAQSKSFSKRLPPQTNSTITVMYTYRTGMGHMQDNQEKLSIDNGMFTPNYQDVYGHRTYSNDQREQYDQQHNTLSISWTITMHNILQNYHPCCSQTIIWEQKTSVPRPFWPPEQCHCINSRGNPTDGNGNISSSKNQHKF